MTFSDLKAAMEAKPWTVVRQWHFPRGDLDKIANAPQNTPEACACRLFVNFTNCLWTLLHNFYKSDAAATVSTTVEEAR